MRRDRNLAWLLLWALWENRQCLLMRSASKERRGGLPNTTGWRYVPVKRPERPLWECAQLVGANGGYRTTLGVILGNTTHVLWDSRWCLSLAGNSPIRLQWGIFCSHLPSAGIISMSLHTHIFMWVLEIKIRSSFFTADTTDWGISPVPCWDVKGWMSRSPKCVRRRGSVSSHRTACTSLCGTESIVNIVEVFMYESPCAWSHKIRWRQGALRS